MLEKAISNCTNGIAKFILNRRGYYPLYKDIGAQNNKMIIDTIFEHATPQEHIADIFKQGRLLSSNRLEQEGIPIMHSEGYNSTHESEREHRDYIEFDVASGITSGEVMKRREGCEAHRIDEKFPVRFFFRRITLARHPNAQEKKFYHFSVRDEVDLVHYLHWAIFPSEDASHIARENANSPELKNLVDNRSTVIDPHKGIVMFKNTIFNPKDYFEFNKDVSEKYCFFWNAGEEEMLKRVYPHDKLRYAVRQLF